MRRIIEYLFGLIICLFLILISSCTGNSLEKSSNSSIDINKTDSVLNSIQCKGIFEIKPQHLCAISVPSPGKIEKIYIKKNDSIIKGQLLFSISNIEFIELQQSYIEAKSQLEYCKEDFKRQGELTVEDAASIKKMQQAKTNYEQIESKTKSLEKQLKYLGINPENILKNGYSAYIFIYAPCSGKIITYRLIKGLYIKPEDHLVEINTGYPQIALKVDINQSHKVQVGDSLTFHISYYPDSHYTAKITAIAQWVNQADNVFDITAEPLSNNELFKPGMPISAEIFITDSSTGINNNN